MAAIYSDIMSKIDTYYLIGMLVLFDGLILACKYYFDRPLELDKELKPDLIINSDYFDLLAIPFIYFFPFIWLKVWTKDNIGLFPIPYLVIGFLFVLTVFLLFRSRFIRIYFSDNGIAIFNLFTKQLNSIPISDILGYSLRKGFRSPSSYLIVTSYKKFTVSSNQIRNLKTFKQYFDKHNIPYYEYDLLTGNDYKK